jgi:hypothetical protein
MMMKLFCVISCALLYLNFGYAQHLVNVSPSTGSANVNIPIYTVTSGSLAVPVSLNYSTNGVKIKDVEGTAGMGWDVQAGGQISRQLRGLPDDYEQGTSLGWMIPANSAASAITTFTPQNTGTGNCSNELSDVSFINSNVPYYQDTEPDIFNVTAPGLSCQLIYDRVHTKFQPVVYQDLKISYVASFGGEGITSFTITNDKGVTYVFGYSEETVQTAFDGTGTYFSTQYNQYKNPGVIYFDAWFLTTMTDPAGNSISFNYTKAPGRNSTDSVSLYLPNTTTQQLQYYIQSEVLSGILQGISTGNIHSSSVSRLTFNWQTFNGPGQTGQTCISSIAGYGRQFNFSYSGVVDTVHQVNYIRNFLRNFTDYGSNSPIGYSFSYNGETNTGGGNYITTLPDSNSFKVDYWGYPNIGSSNTTLQPKALINPSNSAYSRYVIYQAPTETGSYSLATTNGKDRSATTTNYAIGCLATITTAQTGTSSITYEPNKYIDIPSGVQVTGGGVRVKAITDYNGMDVTKNIVRNYTYTVPGGSVSSGRPITLPSYAFDIPYSGSATGQSLWDDVTVLSQNDLSGEDHSIIYGYFSMSQTGAGSTQYNLSTLGSNWDRNVVPICSGCTAVEWNPSIDPQVRSTYSNYTQTKQ